MNIKLQGFYVCEWILFTTVVEFNIKIKQDEDESSHQPTGHKFNEESFQMLTLEHFFYEDEIWTHRKVDQKYLGSSEMWFREGWRRPLGPIV